MQVSDPSEDRRYATLIPNHSNDANELSDKLITRVLSHSTLASMSCPTFMLKMSCVLNPKPIQIKCK